MQAKFLVRNLKLVLSLLILSACASPNAAIQNSGEAGFISGDGTATFLQINERKSAPKLASTDFNGAKISLENFKNKVVVINVWGSWCSPCRKEATELEELYLKNKDSSYCYLNKDLL